jgi:hypothetical protein
VICFRLGCSDGLGDNLDVTALISSGPGANEVVAGAGAVGAPSQCNWTIPAHWPTDHL